MKKLFIYVCMAVMFCGCGIKFNSDIKPVNTFINAIGYGIASEIYKDKDMAVLNLTAIGIESMKKKLTPDTIKPTIEMLLSEVTKFIVEKKKLNDSGVIGYIDQATPFLTKLLEVNDPDKAISQLNVFLDGALASVNYFMSNK